MLPPALRYLPQHGRYEHAVSFAAGVRAGGWRGADKRAFKFAAGISRATNTLLNPLKCPKPRSSLINALAVPKSARF